MITTMRDIDYAADAVRKAIQQKFGRELDVNDLRVEVVDSVIRVSLHDRRTEGTRDELMTAIRKAAELNNIW